MRLFSKILPNVLVLGYVAISLLSLSNCTSKNDYTTNDRLNSAKQKTATLLLQKYNTELFNINSEQILNRPVVLDSTLIGITEKGGRYFLRAEVNLNSSKRCFAELKCSPEIVDSYRRTKSNSVFIAAIISRIDDCSRFAETDSLDGKNSQFNLGKSILLGGECLAISEIPTMINAD